MISQTKHVSWIFSIFRAEASAVNVVQDRILLKGYPSYTLLTSRLQAIHTKTFYHQLLTVHLRTRRHSRF